MVALSTFADWLNAQMSQKGIRSGRRLALETGLDDIAILDWSIGRRVPTPQEAALLAKYFGVAPNEALELRARSEALVKPQQRQPH